MAAPLKFDYFDLPKMPSTETVAKWFIYVCLIALALMIAFYALTANGGN